jgi:hypothetical protein
MEIKMGSTGGLIGFIATISCLTGLICLIAAAVYAGNYQDNDNARKFAILGGFIFGGICVILPIIGITYYACMTCPRQEFDNQNTDPRYQGDGFQ